MRDRKFWVAQFIWLAAPATAQTPAFTAPTIRAPLVDYCVTESVASCEEGRFWEVKSACPPAQKILAVSCSLNNFNYDAALIANAPAPDGAFGLCVWRLTQPPDPTTKGAVTLLCR